MLYLECESEFESNPSHQNKKKTGKVETECYLGPKGTGKRAEKKHFAGAEEEIKKMLTVLKSFSWTCALEAQSEHKHKHNAG